MLKQVYMQQTAVFRFSITMAFCKGAKNFNHKKLFKNHFQNSLSTKDGKIGVAIFSMATFKLSSKNHDSNHKCFGLIMSCTITNQAYSYI